MRLAMRLPPKGSAANEAMDPREQESAEIIDLASRTGYPAVVQRNARSDALGMATGIAVVAGIGAIAFWSMNSARLAPPEGVGNPAVQAPDPAGFQPNVPAAAAAIPEATPIVPISEPAVAAPISPNVGVGPAINPYASPTVVFDAGTLPQVSTGTAQATSTAEALPSGTGAVAGSADAFANRIGGVGGATAQARPMLNPATTVTQGTLIPAVLETAIDTDVPGYVRAMVSQDVRSFDGTQVLVPRSSRLIGQYQSGVQNGQKRAYVIWTRLIRPDGASVNLASPAIGFDGTTGLEGEVKTHFFKRFGSAMLLSVIGSLGTIASGGTSVVLGGAGQSAASVAAQQDSQIGPTIRVHQGEPIRVFTARDLDFSSVN